MAKNSSCIRNCCLSGNDICLGCFRHLDEILSWNSMNNKQKQTTLLKCKQRKERRLAHAKTDFNS